MFSREITIHTVIHGADIRLWPTLCITQAFVTYAHSAIHVRYVCHPRPHTYNGRTCEYFQFDMWLVLCQCRFFPSPLSYLATVTIFLWYCLLCHGHTLPLSIFFFGTVILCHGHTLPLSFFLCHCHTLPLSFFFCHGHTLPVSFFFRHCHTLPLSLFLFNTVILCHGQATVIPCHCLFSFAMVNLATVTFFLRHCHTLPQSCLATVFFSLPLSYLATVTSLLLKTAAPHRGP